jgi:ABC-type glycerol-3-phosphate transport system substrate-binding protein
MKNTSRGSRSLSAAVSRRRGVARAAGLVGAYAAAVACAPAGQAERADRPAPATPVAVELWATANSANTARVDRWNATHPKVTLTLGAVPTGGQGVDAVQQFLVHVAAGDAAHAAWFDRFQIGSFAYRGAFLPLDAYVKRDRLDLKVFVPALLREAYGNDGRLYGLPANTDNRMLYWNRAQLREANLPATAPATWEDLKTAVARAQRLDAPPGSQRAGFAFKPAFSFSFLYLWAWQNGADFVAADGRKATLNDPRVIETWQWIKSMIDVQGGYERLQAFQNTLGSGAQHPFLTGQQAIMGVGGGFLTTVARYRPELDVGYDFAPRRKAGDPPLTMSGGFAWVVPQGIAHPDTGWELARWLTSEESFVAAADAEQSAGAAAGGAYRPGMTAQPALDRLLFERYKSGDARIDTETEWMLASMRSTRTRPVNPANAELWDTVLATFDTVMLGQKGVQAALDEANRVVQLRLDEAWARGAKT